jgi:predicted nucleotide-binding protein
VFLVHGHDEAVRESVARYLGQLGLTPVILHEQASRGRTVIEKLEHHANVAFAAVLLTPDDLGATLQAPGNLRPRARQNVVLELGFFVGKLGRDRVCATHRGDLELPSDYMGVLYVPFDDGGGWKLLLARELRAAGFDVNMNAAL